ncbi:MAG: APC family permease [Methanomassiliicoccales archaeon]|nr:APC family permease [Methanomassiliicoccales archaeon]
MPGLKAELGFFDAFSIGVGAIIGAGIFVVTGVAAGLAGPALLISLLIAALVSAFTAFSFAELAYYIPKEGGGFEFAHELVSPLGGFIAGWAWIVANIVTGAVVALGFASYLALYIPLPVNLIAAVTVVALTAVNYIGVKESGRLNDVLVIFKLGVLVIFVVMGLGLVKTSNFTPFFTNGAGGVMEGAALIFFAYSGFGRVAMVSEEVKDPKRTVPKATLLSVLVATVVYVVVAFVAIGLVGADALAGSGSPLATAAIPEGSGAVALVTLAGLAATMSVLLTTLLGVSRISYAMAKTKDLPKALAKINPRTQVPGIAIVAFGGLTAILALSTDILFAASISNFAAIIYYALVNVAALKLRKPVYSRAMPILGLITCMIVALFLPLEAIILGAAAVGVGTAVHLAFRRRHPPEGVVHEPSSVEVTR